jgi:hypothetical protein
LLSVLCIQLNFLMNIALANIVPAVLDAGLLTLLREIMLRDDHRFRHSAFETLRLLTQQPCGAREVLKDKVLCDAIVKLAIADIGHWLNVQAPADLHQLVADFGTKSEPQYSDGPHTPYTSRTLSQSAGLAAVLQVLANLLQIGERLVVLL